MIQRIIPANKRNPRWHTADKVMLATLIGWFGLNFLGPLIETRFFPVSSTFTPTLVQMSGVDQSRLEGFATKHRGCTFLGLDWYIGIQGEGASRVSSSFLDRPQIRSPGVLSWTDLRVGLNPVELCGHSYAYVEHSCHPFWITRSLFFVGITGLSPSAGTCEDSER